MTRLLLAAVLITGLASCEPEYAETAGHDAAQAEHPEVVGGADPTAVSGEVPADSGTIHHPAADGNSGRPAARR